MRVRPGIFSNSFWIWPERMAGLRNIYADFRHDFILPGRPVRAPFYVTADQCYMCHVNGKYVGRGPARGFQRSWPFDEYDLAPLLRRGHNWLSIRAYNAGVGTFQYVHQEAFGMLCAGRAGAAKLDSGEQWLARISPAYRHDTAKLSVQLNFQEWADARLDNQSWIKSARRPCGWRAPGLCRPFGNMPWHSVEPRGLPNLGNDKIKCRSIIARASGRADRNYHDPANITLPWFNEVARLHWRVCRESKEWVCLPAAGANGLRAVVFDIGRPAAGNLIAEVFADRGTMVDFFFCETVNTKGAPAMGDPDKGCRISLSARLITGAGRTQFEFFQIIGCRYIVMIVRDTRHPTRARLAFRETVYPLAIRGGFRCGDVVFKDIYRISVQTQRVCILDGYVDTPWREQGQWWGDARVQAQNTFHLSADARPLARGIRIIGGQEVPNGLTYGLAPTSAHNCILPDFSLIWILSIWDYFFQTGEIGIFLEQCQRLQRLLRYFQTEGRANNGLLRHDRRYWLFLDWSEIYKDGNPALLNLWYLLALEKTAKLAGMAGLRSFQRAVVGEYDRLHKIIMELLWNPQEGLFHDGLSANSRRVPGHSIHVQTLALLCRLHPSGFRNMIKKRLLPYLNESPVPGPKPSSYWVTYIYEVMKRLGYGREVARHIRRHWAPMIPSGGTWEVFENKPGIHSVSHAWSAHPIYHLAGTLGGIIQKSAGWKMIDFRPVILTECRYCEVETPTPLGTIKSSWQVGRRGGEVALRLPRGIRAHVLLPGANETVFGSRKWRVGILNNGKYAVK